MHKKNRRSLVQQLHRTSWACRYCCLLNTGRSRGQPLNLSRPAICVVLIFGRKCRTGVGSSSAPRSEKVKEHPAMTRRLCTRVLHHLQDRAQRHAPCDLIPARACHPADSVHTTRGPCLMQDAPSAQYQLDKIFRCLLAFSGSAGKCGTGHSMKQKRFLWPSHHGSFITRPRLRSRNCTTGLRQQRISFGTGPNRLLAPARIVTRSRMPHQSTALLQKVRITRRRLFRAEQTWFLCSSLTACQLNQSQPSTHTEASWPGYAHTMLIHGRSPERTAGSVAVLINHHFAAVP